MRPRDFRPGDLILFQEAPIKWWFMISTDDDHVIGWSLDKQECYSWSFHIWTGVAMVFPMTVYRNGHQIWARAKRTIDD